MATMTKATIVTWAVDANPTDAYLIEFLDQIDTYINNGVTDGSAEILTIAPTTRKRLWVDQTAAQEFLDFLTTLGNKHTFLPSSVAIENV